MEFIAGFMLAWFLLGCFALVGLDQEWYLSESGFWVILSIPAIPVMLLVFRLRDRFR